MTNPNFTVKFDRTTTIPKLKNNAIVIPFGKDGTLVHSAKQIAAESGSLRLSRIQRDLIDIATAISYADRYCKRASREEWSRNISIDISLRELESFQKVQQLLEFCLNVVSGDNIHFNPRSLEQNEFEWDAIFRYKRPLRPEEIINYDCVSLLSGGQDSTSGAINLIEHNRTPIFVRINTLDRAKAKDIHTSLHGVKRNRSKLYNHQVPAVKDNNNPDFSTEESQRMRSFYFLAIASVIADSNNLEEIYINENGIMAIHLPLDISRSSTFSTRTAYPLFLDIFQEVIRSWLGNSKLKILNKWILKTKAEVLLEMKTDYSKKIISRDTRSCAHAARVKLTESNTQTTSFLKDGTGKDHHCGYCFPCILRRVSMFNAKIPDVDYLANPFKLIFYTNYGKYDQVKEASSAIFSLISFYIFFKDSSEEEINTKYPQLLESAYVLGVNVSELIAFHKRFCIEVYRYIESNEPRLLFLLDQKSSKKAEIEVRKLNTSAELDALVKNLQLKGYNEHFEEIMESTYNDVRFFIQAGIANELTNREKIVNELKASIQEIIPGNLKDRQETELNNNDGNKVRLNIKERCAKGLCYPLG